MTKIDTSEWKEFVIDDLFDIHPTKDLIMELAGMQIQIVQRKPEPLHLLTQQRKAQILFSIKREISSVIRMCKGCMPRHINGQGMKGCS